MSEHLTPVDVIFRLFDGPEGVAELLGGHAKTPYSWKRGSNLREPGDIPSTRIMRQLLAIAAARKIPLNADHLIFGASEGEMVDLLKFSEAA